MSKQYQGFWLLGVLGILTGCATTTPAPVVERTPGQSSVATNLPPATASGPSAASEASTQNLLVQTPPAITSTVLPPPTTVSAPPPSVTPAKPVDNRALLNHLLPPRIPERNGWADDIQKAFLTLKLEQSTENYCAAMAVIEQLSSWQSDPVVPDLGDKVWMEVGARAAKYHIPLFTVKAALSVPLLDGSSFKARIDALRTERQMNDLFEAIVGEAPQLAKRFGITNPIRTGGPMQVSVEFANEHVHSQPYPYPIKGSLRKEVFTRHGGVYFGIAHLLQYPAPYTNMIYRFADYNGGRYSSRNAAFQTALAKVSGARVDPDGDLLIYQNGQPARSQSSTTRALLKLAPKLGLTKQQIMADIRQEKTSTLGQTPTYQRVFALADKATGHPVPREALPQIHLQSVKISHNLTTQWFAEKVNGHYQQCLARQ
ncbi:DUF1615 domain-containing protein [Uliginosibacterium gangwonense]|uniref:DUF1615 domain-containing protein n=1 Tax=Uliginosibacterium gangwonense TaxID=392736 RepID=UPI00037097B6|nr:DUF1615 domain-containing protein [Uliginosibacterium gangwonense]